MTQAAAPAGRTTAPGTPTRAHGLASAGEDDHRRNNVRIGPTVVIGTSGEISGNAGNVQWFRAMSYIDPLGRLPRRPLCTMSLVLNTSSR